MPRLALGWVTIRVLNWMLMLKNCQNKIFNIHFFKLAMHSPETRIYMAKTAVIYGSDNLVTLERTKVYVPVLDLISYRYKVSAFRI